MRRILALAVVLALATGLAGCLGDDEEPVTEPDVNDTCPAGNDTFNETGNMSDDCPPDDTGNTTF